MVSACRKFFKDISHATRSCNESFLRLTWSRQPVHVAAGQCDIRGTSDMNNVNKLGNLANKTTHNSDYSSLWLPLIVARFSVSVALAILQHIVYDFLKARNPEVQTSSPSIFNS